MIYLEVLRLSETWKPESVEFYVDRVETLEAEAADELNEWETDFVANIQQRLSVGLNLTEAQTSKLEEIYVDKILW